MPRKRRKPIFSFLITAASLLAAAIIFVVAVNVYVVSSTRDSISSEDSITVSDYDCVVVPGSFVTSDGDLGNVVRQRLDKAIELYKKGVVPKIIVSGDHGREEYDEVNAMKAYAVSKGVKDTDIFMDHAGFSTYDTVYRTRDIFQADKVIFVTQKYHLYRSLYISSSLGVEATGVSSSDDTSVYIELRESLARVKAFLMCAFKVEPKYLGQAIPVNGDGNLTDDENTPSYIDKYTSGE